MIRVALGEQPKFFPDCRKILKKACAATALQSKEITSETILAGKAKVMAMGGFDDLCEEGSYEFGNAIATGNSRDCARGGS
jgi:3-oxoacyl-(acyl-carrier-protein) synthase